MYKNLFVLPLLIVIIITLTYPTIASDEGKPSTLESTAEHPRNCKDVLDEGYNTSDFYLIQPLDAPEPFFVFCNMESSGGGWTTILSRDGGTLDFYKDWTNYKTGFGNLGGEFWLGLEKIYYITRYELNELLFELVDWEDVQKYAHYDSFSIGSEEEGYALNLVHGYSGTAGDSFTSDASLKFTTPDNDQSPNEAHCGDRRHAGWWYYYDCGHANPNGRYGSNYTDGTGIFWNTFHGYNYSLQEVRMMVRARR